MTSHFGGYIQISVTKNNVPALLGVGLFNLLQDQKTKFRNILKKIAKFQYSTKTWREFEKTYLILATTYLERKTTGLALDLCKRCLFHNKSCKKALELMGFIMEGMGNHLEAINHYHRYWKLENKSSLPTGSRLALLNLKTKNHQCL